MRFIVGGLAVLLPLVAQAVPTQCENPEVLSTSYHAAFNPTVADGRPSRQDTQYPSKLAFVGFTSRADLLAGLQHVVLMESGKKPRILWTGIDPQRRIQTRPVFDFSGQYLAVATHQNTLRFRCKEESRVTLYSLSDQKSYLLLQKCHENSVQSASFSHLQFGHGYLHWQDGHHTAFCRMKKGVSDSCLASNPKIARLKLWGGPRGAVKTVVPELGFLAGGGDQGFRFENHAGEGGNVDLNVYEPPMKSPFMYRTFHPVAAAVYHTYQVDTAPHEINSGKHEPLPEPASSIIRRVFLDPQKKHGQYLVKRGPTTLLTSKRDSLFMQSGLSKNGGQRGEALIFANQIDINNGSQALIVRDIGRNSLPNSRSTTLASSGAFAHTAEFHQRYDYLLDYHSPPMAFNPAASGNFVAWNEPKPTGGSLTDAFQIKVAKCKKAGEFAVRRTLGPGSGHRTGTAAQLNAMGLPTFGQSVCLHTMGPKNHLGQLWMSPRSRHSSTLLPGCITYLDPAGLSLLSGFKTDANGSYFRQIFIPNDARLEGLEFNLQAVFPTANSVGGFQATDGLHFKIGY